MSEQNSEPWFVGPGKIEDSFGVFSDDDTCIATAWSGGGVSVFESRRNAERIAACVNACRGLNPEALADFIRASKAVADSSRVHAEEDGCEDCEVYFNEFESALAKLEDKP